MGTPPPPPPYGGRIRPILNYSKTYRISLVNKDCLSLAVKSQPPSPAFIVSKSEGKCLFIIGFFMHKDHISI